MDEEKRSDLIIEELKKRKRRDAIVNVEAEYLKLVIFTLRNGLYAFPGADIVEILPLMHIFPVPGAPDFMPGVINNRGDIESVINLNIFLGLPECDRTAVSRIAMASKNGLRSGILVDAVLDVVDLPRNSIRPPLSTLGNAVKDLVTGETVYDSRTVVILDVGRLFDRLAIHDR